MFAKQKYIARTVELAESLFMELQLCQFEALGKDMTKQNKQHVKGHVWTFLGQVMIQVNLVTLLLVIVLGLVNVVYLVYLVDLVEMML